MTDPLIRHGGLVYGDVYGDLILFIIQEAAELILSRVSTSDKNISLDWRDRRPPQGGEDARRRCCENAQISEFCSSAAVRHDDESTEHA